MAKNVGTTMYIMCRKYRILEGEGKIEFYVENEFYEPAKIIASFYRTIGGENDFYCTETDTPFEPKTAEGEYILGRLKACYEEVRQRHQDL